MELSVSTPGQLHPLQPIQNPCQVRDFARLAFEWGFQYILGVLAHSVQDVDTSACLQCNTQHTGGV
jgi:hypothetical protein